MPVPTATNGKLQTAAKQRYRLPGIEREGIAQLSLLETALWPLRGGILEGVAFDAGYTFTSDGKSHEARGSVYSPHGLQSVDEYILWGLLGVCLSRQQPEPTLLATPYWIIKRLGMSMGGSRCISSRVSSPPAAAEDLSTPNAPGGSSGRRCSSGCARRRAARSCSISICTAN